MEDMGIIRRSDSPWSSSLHMVPKNSGGWRPCGDYRRLNDVTTADRYPVPHIQDFASQLAGASIFSKIDLVRGYHHIPVASEDVSNTAVITPFGLFEFLRTPFGLKNAAQAFQRLMDTVCNGLDFVFVFLDDILVSSTSAEQHMLHLQEVFHRLSTHGLVINVSKCQFGATTISCHVVRTQTMLRIDFARQFASWHLVLPFDMVRNRHICRLHSPTTVSCSSGETVTARRSRRLTRAPIRCWYTAISRLC